MVYQDNSDLRLGSPSTSFNYFSMRANSVFDPDPLLATGGISGFSEWGTFFRIYRVTAVQLRWEVINVPTNPPIVVGIVPSSTVPTAATRTTVINLLENKFVSPIRSISVSGGMDRAVINYHLSLRQFVGNPTVLTDRDYAGFMGSSPGNPSQVIFLNFIAYCPSSSVLTVNVVSNLKITYFCNLSDRQTLSG